MDAIYIILLLLCTGLTLMMAWVKCSSSKWLMAFLGFLSGYLCLILLDSQDFYISPQLYFCLLSICFLPGPIILGYIGHISTRTRVDGKDFLFCLLPPMTALLCNDLLGGFSLTQTVDQSAYQASDYTALFNLISAMAGLHLLTYLARATQLIVQMRRDWSSYESRTLPESWYDAIRLLLVFLITCLTQVASAFIHPAGDAVSIGDLGFVALVVYFLYLGGRNTLRKMRGQQEEEVIVETETYLSDAQQRQQPALSSYQASADYIEQQMQQHHLFLQDELSLSSLAEQLDTTPHRLSEVLNHHFRKTFYEFINDLRVQYAAELLISEPKRSIADIYFASGFTTKSTFYSHFKKAFHCTPSEYRKHGVAEPASH